MDLREQLQVTLGDAYKLENELGGAGMSRVFVATDTVLNRKIVIKVLPTDVTGGISTERFRREIRLSASLQHPCIVPLLASGITEQSPFYTMPLIQGESLRARLDRDGKLSIAETMRIIRDVASALAYASERGVVHRDLKPGNILLSGGYALVTDFGIAKALSVSAAAPVRDDLTALGITVGTPAYMSPEQAAADPALDQRADIYALGVIAYEMLTGKPPFHGRPGRALLAAHLFEEPKQIKGIRPDVPSALASLVMACLQKDPARRPQTGIDVLHGLEIDYYTSDHQPVLLPKPVPSMAVLPFTNLSADPANEYFSDGMTEEIINALTHLRGVRVASRTSSFTFKGKDVDLKKIGELLNVQWALSGSVRRSDNRLRVAAELVNIADGTHIWSERYDREFTDVFDIQDEISAAIVNALEITLLGSDQMAARKRPTENLEAYDLYLKGRYYWNQRGDGLQKGLEFFQLALQLDPDFPLANVGVADAYNLLGFYDFMPGKDAYAKAKAAVLRALEIDESLSEAHSCLGFISLYYDWNWELSGSELKRALDLNPTDVNARMWLGCLHMTFRRFDEGLREIKRATEIDPLSIHAQMTVGWFLFVSRRYEEAVEQFRKAIDLNPHVYLAHMILGYTYLALGRNEDAIASVQRAVALSVRLPWTVGALGYVHGKVGNKREAEKLLKELLSRSSKEYVPLSRLALAYAGTGDKEKVLDCLERAYEEREAWNASLLVDSAWDDLRSEPRFRRLVDLLHLADEDRQVELDVGKQTVAAV